MKTKKTLFIGGIKSGKSFHAQNYILKQTQEKPIYLATTEFIDEGMHKRIQEHKNQRKDSFKTVEEPLQLYNIISKSKEAVLVECVSMWINNMLYHKRDFNDMVEDLEAIFRLKKSVVFVLNDVGSGIIPDNALAREFIDISGKLSQVIATNCDEVYHTIAGISTRIK